MGLSNGILTYPFTKIATNGNGDLQRALGVSSTGMTQANLFANGNINKWSKKKAFCHSTIFTDKYTDNNSQRLAGLKAAYYGFGYGNVVNIPVYTSASALHSGFSAANEGNVWTYTRPTIGNYPLRALDFDGYAVSAAGWGLGKYTDANNTLFLNAPFNAYIECRTTIGNNMDFYLGISAVSSGASSGLLSISDFSSMSGFENLASWYYGVALISKTGTYSNDYYYVLNSAISGNISEAITMTSSVANGTYYIVPILASAHTGNAWVGSSSFPTKCVTLDGWFGEITKSSSVSGVTWTADWEHYGSYVRVTIVVKNNTGAAITVNKIFSYTMTDVTSESPDYYSALNTACQAWVNSGTENSAGVKNSSNVVIAAYKSLLSTNTNIGASQTQTFTYDLVTYGSNDALGNPYDEYADVRICLRYNTTINLCNKIY